MLNRNKSSLLNAVVSLSGMFIVMLSNLILIRLIIYNYGSDANGIMSTVTQTISMLTIVEAGMTMAINVSLYKPYVNQQNDNIERILAAANKIFYVIGLSFLIIGFIFSWFYPYFVKSDIPISIIRFIFIANIIPYAINYAFTTKYRIMFQVAQKEYIVNIINYTFTLISLLANYLVIVLDGSLIVLSLSTMIVSIIRCFIIYIPYKRMFGYLDTKKKEPNYNAARGSWDVITQRITAVVYSSMPVVFISTFVSTSMASVYTVYAAVFGIIKQVTYVFINAPQQGFGQLLAQRGPKALIFPFKSYQLLSVMVLNSLLTTASILVIPFVELYTDGVTDINYLNVSLVFLLIVITYLEIIHIPSGIVINISRKFKVSRNIQLISTAFMIVIGIIGGYFWGMVGILLGKVFCNIMLSILEIRYTYKYILRTSIMWFLKVLFVNLIISTLIYVVCSNINILIDNYYMFIFSGIIYLMIALLLVLLVNYLFFKENVIDLSHRLLKVLLPNLKKLCKL